MAQEKPDLQFYNHGSIITCYPHTEAGRNWLEENVEAEGVEPLVIEPRFLENLVEGARADGLVCHG